MRVEVTIDAPLANVWKRVTDIGNSAAMIRGIDKVQILSMPASGLVGLKWKETRTLFGKTAEETMTVTGCVENEHYTAEARSHGSVYTSRISVRDAGDGRTVLSMEFRAVPLSVSAKVLWCTMGFLFSGATKKALLEDLRDIKRFVEQEPKG